ncbi:MAG: hypothetical protein AAF961_04215 [Planctomycetota bacterium]
MNAFDCDFRCDAVWPTPTEADRRAVVEFWQAEGALPDQQSAAQRSAQLLVVGRDSRERIAGVSTAVPHHVKQLGFRCFYYRTFVGRRSRARGLKSTQLFWAILAESYQRLNDRFRQGHDPEVLGLYAEIESRSIMRRRNDLVWNDGGMNAVYIGRTAQGRHQRVWYFDGARAPL